jgi:hypothetical protein
VECGSSCFNLQCPMTTTHSIELMPFDSKALTCFAPDQSGSKQIFSQLAF